MADYNSIHTGSEIDEAVRKVKEGDIPAESVKFTDGETFQQKLDAGDLTGPAGAIGATGPTGPAGPAGADGETPEKGVDYFTQADKQELLEELSEQVTAEDVGAYSKEDIYDATIQQLYGLSDDTVPKDVLEALGDAISVIEYTPDIDTYEDVPVGNSVYINIDGTPTEFIVVHQGKPSEDYDESCNGTWLMMKDIFFLGRWGAKTSPPHYWSTTINDYLNETFYNKIDPSIREYVKPVNIPVENTTFTAKVFALSASEIGGSKTDSEWLGYEEGSKLAYFVSGSTSEANSKRIATYNGSNNAWLLRSIDNNGTYASPYIVSSDGSYINSTDNVNRGYLPVFIFPFKDDLRIDIFSNQKGEDITGQVKNIINASQIETGSYVGTGTYGQNNPNSLTFGFEPKLVIIAEASGSGYMIVFINGANGRGISYGSATSIYTTLSTTWQSKGISWYVNNAYNGLNANTQLNSSSSTYYYVAIG